MIAELKVEVDKSETRRLLIADVNMVLASQGSRLYRVATIIHGTQARPSAIRRVIEPYRSSSRRALATATELADGDHPAHSLSQLPDQREYQ